MERILVVLDDSQPILLVSNEAMLMRWTCDFNARVSRKNSFQELDIIRVSVGASDNNTAGLVCVDPLLNTQTN